MRILLVVDSLEVGGAEQHVTDLARALRATGYLVTVACATGGPLVAELEAARVPVHVLVTGPVKHRVDLRFAWKLRRVLRAGEFDLVHAHLYAGAVAAALAVIGIGCARVVTVHSESRWQRHFARSVSGYVYRTADAILAVSEPIAHQLTVVHGVAPDRTTVIANALYPTALCTRRRRATLRGGVVVGVAGRLHRDKGVDVLLDAMVRVLYRHPQVQTVVVGDGPQREHLQRKARSLGLDDRVSFLGCIPGARNLIPSFDVLVVPSRTEGSPLVVLEAMAAGIPVVASCVGGIPDQIRHGVTGLLVAPDNPGELGKAIEQLLCEPATRNSLAAEGRRQVAERFPYRVLLDGIERVYAEALARRSARNTRGC